MAEANPSFGYRATEAIAQARLTKTAAGQVFTKKDAAAIIDTMLTAEAPKKPSKAISSQFGDRKKIPPLPEWVTAYSAHIGYPLDGQKWCDTYGAKGWMIGKNKMKDWQCSVITWRTNDYASPGMKLGAAAPVNGVAKDYSKFMP